MDIGSIRQQVEDGREKLADAWSRRAVSTEQLIGVMRHVEESLSVTWEKLRETEAQQLALMEEYRQLSILLVTASDTLAEAQTANSSERTGEANDEEGSFDPDAFKTAFSRVRARRQSANGQSEPVLTTE